MTLGDFEILPGVVINVEDPLNQGRVKAVAPGLFDTSTMDEDDLFWINPFMMTGKQTFSKLSISSKIWILHNKSNYFEYWYIPMFEINDDMPDEIAGDDADVLYSRSVNGNKVQFYFSRETGLNIIIGDNTLQLSEAGKLTMKAQSSIITADNTGITLANSGAPVYSTVKGEKLVSVLDTHGAFLLTTAAAAAYNPFTLSLALPLLASGTQLIASSNNIKSTFVKIS